MEIKKRAVICVALVILFGCARKSGLNYTYFSYLDQFQVRTINLPKVRSMDDLNGEWRFESKDDVLIEKGDFKNGIKVGDWFYYLPERGDPLHISWKPFETAHYGMVIPSTWKAQSTTDSLLTFSFPTTSEEKSNKYFAIIENERGQDSAQSYWKYHASKTLGQQKITQSWFNRIRLGGKEIYFSIYDKEELSVLTMVIEQGDKIYDIGYSSKKGFLPEKYIYFFDVIRNTRVDGEMIFPSLSTDTLIFNQLEVQMEKP